jgi:4-hydroxy-tetrahydrodipicolinate synthase
MLYNVPGRTSCNLAAATTLRLAELPNVAAIKEASGNLDQVAEIIRDAPEGFAVYSGDDSLTLPMLAIGSVGIVSVAAHVVGPQMRDMIDAFVSGRTGEAAAIHLRLMPIFKGLFATTNPILVKAALRLQGFECGGLRPPLVEATEKELSALRETIKQTSDF